MTISILPENYNGFRAVAGDKQSTGRTAGEALDRLDDQLSGEENGTLVIVQNRRADIFFSESERQRLTGLMNRCAAQKLTSAEEAELERLIETELDGASRRAENPAGGLLP